jgi:hypothetical protein
VTCGKGVQTRNVSCANGEEEDCAKSSARPEEKQECTVFTDCQWNTSRWGHCEAQCGSGSRKRDVSCRNGRLEDCQQSPGNIPPSRQPCFNTSACSWTIGPWGPCSNICGEGKQFRSVICANGREEDCAANSQKPGTFQKCEETSGCLNLAHSAPSCQCPANDPSIVAAGGLNAACGWIVTFAIMHEMVNRGGMMGLVRPGIASTMLSPPAVILAGIGALASSAVLETSLKEQVSAVELPAQVGASQGGLQDFLDQHILQLGFAGIAVWASSLAILGMTSCWCDQKPVGLASVATLFAFVGLTLFMASGVLGGFDSSGSLGGGAGGGGTAMYSHVAATARRLRGELEFP